MEKHKAPDKDAGQGGRTEHLEVLLALSATRKKPLEECPSLEDLLAWTEGSSKGADAGVMLSHLAHCEDCYDHWMGIVEVLETEVETVQEPPITHFEPTAIRRWLQDMSERSLRWSAGIRIGLTGGGLVAAALALLLVMVYLPATKGPSVNEAIDSSFMVLRGYYANHPVPQSWPWPLPSLYMTRGPGPLAVSTAEQMQHDMEIEAFQAGLRKGIERARLDTLFWRNIQERLPETTDFCKSAPAPDACQKLGEDMENAGQWAILLYLACDGGDPGGGEAGASSPTFWEEQQKTLLKLSESLANNGASRDLVGFLESWKGEAGGTADLRKAFCGRVHSFIKLGMDQPL